MKGGTDKKNTVFENHFIFKIIVVQIHDVMNM